MPVCYVIAGPNGAGKTTFASEFLPRYAGVIPFVNPDLIAKGLSPFDVGAVAIRAGRLVLERIEELISKRANFAFETTLSGRSHIQTLKRLKKAGYRIRLIYLWIPTSKLAMARIAERVRRGGHDIPEADVIRRMKRSIDNLLALYQPLANGLWLMDNSGTTYRVIAVWSGARKRVFHSTAYRTILESA